MSKSVNKLLTVPPSCCCNSLSSPAAFSPWTSDIMQKVKPVGPHKYHRMIFEVEDCLSSNSKVFTSSKHSLSNSSSDSKSASIASSKLLLPHSNHQIPYQFAHQSSSTSAIEEYRSKYTYPTLQKRVVSAHTVERNHCCAVKYSAQSPAPSCNNCYARSLSESQMSTMLKPRTVILEDSFGKDMSDQSRKQFIPKGRILPSPKVIIGFNQIMHPKYEVVKQPAAIGLEKKLSTIRCSSHTEIPTFTSAGKVNKPKSSTEDIKKKYSLKPRQQKKPIPAAKCKNMKLKIGKPGGVQGHSNAFHVNNSSPVHKFGYSSSSATTQSPQRQQPKKDDKPRSIESGGQCKYSVRMISSPWEERRNTL